MITSLLFIFSLFLVSINGASSTCSADVSVTQKSTYAQAGLTFTQYDIKIVNTGSCTLTSLTASLIPSDDTLSQSWNWNASTNAFALFGGIKAGQTSTSAGLIVVGGTPVSVLSKSAQCSSECSSAPPSSSSSGSGNTLPDPTPLPGSNQQCAEGFCVDAPSEYAGKAWTTAEQAACIRNALTVVDRMACLPDTATTFDFYSATTGVTKNEVATKVQAWSKNWPGIIGLGMSTLYIRLEACGLNLPHLHPRGTTVQNMIQGTILTGFIMEDGEHFRTQNVSKGMTTIIPQGSIHFEQNLLCTPAEFVATFNSEDPGVTMVLPSYIQLPLGVAAASMGLTEQQFVQLAEHIPMEVILGMQECRNRCGL